MTKRLALGLAALLCSAGAASAQIALEEASSIFREADELCGRDAGSTWGVSLCGPVLLVQPSNRSFVANVGDGEGLFEPDGRFFRGVLPSNVLLANTPTDWAGRRWTMLLWPLPEDDAERRVMIAHELFHRVQNELGLSRGERANSHLDTLEGRYLIQMEWRALGAALRAPGRSARLTSLGDALYFRAARHAAFPRAAADERALDVAEGVPEYTGLRVGLLSPTQRTEYALFDLERFVEAPSFVRAFAYASGPAYGLLLDEFQPAWRTMLTEASSPPDLLASAVEAHLPTDERSLANLVSTYDPNGALRQAEETRENQRQEMLAAYRAELVQGPVVKLPFRAVRYQFNPQTLVPLDEHGTVYPVFEARGPWGELTMSAGGALLAADRSSIAITAAGLGTGQLWSGRGWSLRLAEGWSFQQGERAGDWDVVQTQVDSSRP